MDTSLQEKVNAGVLYLYNALSKNDFYGRLEALMAELFTGCRYSILVPADDKGRFYLEFSSASVTQNLETPTVESPELVRWLKGVVDDPGSAANAILVVPDGVLPIVDVKTMTSEDSVLGLMVLHDALVFQNGEALFGLEGYLFDHIFTALEQVRERDQMLERLEENQARLDAIRELGNLLCNLDLKTLLSHLMAVCIRLTDAQVGSIVLEEIPGTDVEWGLPRSVLRKIRRKGQPPVVDVARETRGPILLRGYATSADSEPVEDFYIDSVLCVPLVSKDRVLGCVNLVNSDTLKGGMFAEKDKTAIVTISSLAAATIENAILHREALERERLKENLEIARSIQRRLYPVQALKIPGYDLAWLTRSCDETGGDYFDFLPLGKDRVTLAIGDVSGHGIGAALLMATGRADLRALLSVKTDLQEVMDRMNSLLEGDMDNEKFMTLFVAALDPSLHTLTYVNAGHDPPILLRHNGAQVHDLASTGVPLGMMPGWSYDKGPEFSFQPGDTLLLTTDGVWEAASEDGQRLGKARLRELLRTCANKTAREVVETVVAALDKHLGGIEAQDDVTLLVLKRCG